MNFFKSFSFTFISTLFVTLFGVLNNIIITRQLGPSGRGEYSVIMTFVLLAALLLGEGIKRSNTILVGKDRSYYKSLVMNTIFYSLIITVILLILSYFDMFHVLLYSIKNQYLFIAVLSIGLYILWQSLQGILLGTQNILFYNILLVSTILFCFIFNLLGIYFFDFQLIEILKSYLAATFITVILAFVGIKRSKTIHYENKKATFSKLGSLSSRSTLSTLGSFLMIRSGIFFSNYYLGKIETGLLSIALLFFELLQKLPNTIGTLILTMTVNDNSTTNDIKTAKIIRTMFFIDLLAILFFFIAGKYLIVFLFGEDFQYSMILIYYLFPAFVVVGPSSILYAYYMGKGYPKKIIILNLTLAVLSIISLFGFVNNMGIIAVPIIISVFNTIWVLVMIIFFKLDTSIAYKRILFVTGKDFDEITTGFINLIKKVS